MFLRPTSGGTLSRPGETPNPKHSSSHFLTSHQNPNSKHQIHSTTILVTETNHWQPLFNMAYPKLPETMRSLCTRKFGTPSQWEIAELPTPKITKSDDVIVKVHAASINPTDIGGAAGYYRLAVNIP